MARIISEEKGEKVKQVQRPCRKEITLRVRRENGLNETKKKKRRRTGTVYVHMENISINSVNNSYNNGSSLLDRIRNAVASGEGIGREELQNILQEIGDEIIGI